MTGGRDTNSTYGVQLDIQSSSFLDCIRKVWTFEDTLLHTSLIKPYSNNLGIQRRHTKTEKTNVIMKFHSHSSRTLTCTVLLSGFSPWSLWRPSTYSLTTSVRKEGVRVTSEPNSTVGLENLDVPPVSSSQSQILYTLLFDL